MHMPAETRGIGIDHSALHSFHRSIVEISPPDIACRRLENWGAIQADIVKITRREPFDYGFQARRHLLIAYERAERHEGETSIDGLPRSTLREFNCKLCFVPAGRRFYGWETPRVLTRVTYFYIDCRTGYLIRDPASPALRSALAFSSSIKRSGTRHLNSKLKSAVPIPPAASMRRP